MEDDNNTACKLQFTQDKMAEERLKEIKTSIDFQVTATKAYGYDETLINEEIELYNYITNLQHTEDLYNQLLKDYDKLQERIEKAVEYVEQHKFNKFGDIDCGEAEAIIDILNGRSDE